VIAAMVRNDTRRGERCHGGAERRPGTVTVIAQQYLHQKYCYTSTVWQKIKRDPGGRVRL